LVIPPPESSEVPHSNPITPGIVPADPGARR
jgi:hypothetical protein